jgi:chemotaxis signal transduction protein
MFERSNVPGSGFEGFHVGTNMRQMVTTAEELRRTFDRGFAEPPAATTASEDDFLAVTIADDSFLMRLSQVAGLFADKKWMWLPGSVAELVGLVGLRGTILPVYDLRAMLGYPRMTTDPRWFVLAAGAPVALAFDRFDGYRRVPRHAAAAAGRIERHTPHVREIARIDGRVRPILHVPSVVDAIARLAASARRGSDHP